MKRNFNHAKYFIFLLCLFLDLSSAKGQQLDFEKYYFNNLSFRFDNHYVIKTSDNNFLMTGNTVGFSNSYFLLKIDQFGDSIWLKTPPYGGPLTSGQTIKELSNGNYAVLCTEWGSYQRLLLVIYNSSGDSLTSNRYVVNGDLYITNINESNGSLFILGVENNSLGTYIIQTDLFGDSVSCHLDTAFQIANHNNAVCFDGGSFVIAGTTRDTSGIRHPSVEKIDTTGNVLWKVDYLQFPESFGYELFSFLNGYVLHTISMSNGENMIRIDSIGSIIWDTQITPGITSVISPDNTRILVVADAIDLYWYDSTGTYIQGQSFTLTLPGSQYLANAFADNQQIYVSGTVQTGQSPVYSSGFLVQLTDTFIVSTNDHQRNYNNYVYPTVGTPGEQIYFHVVDKISKDTKYAIYSTHGTFISEGAIFISDPYSEPSIKIPESVTSGLYFLKVFSNNSNYTFRIIVQ